MSEVPSNLIPTRITQLPYAPVASEESLLLIVYQGNTYQIMAGDLLQVAGVPTSRQVIAGTGLTGGGQLTDNVTLSIANGGVGTTQLSSTGVTAGQYGSATEIPVFSVDAKGRITAATTIPATVSGYVPTSREVIAGEGLNGGGPLNANVTLNVDLASATPLPGDQAGSAGSSTDVARADHVHPAVDLSDADEVDGILGLSNGGTAKSLVANAGAIIWSGADGLYVGPAGAAGQILQSNGTSGYVWVNQSTLNVARASNLNGGAANRIPVQTALNTTGFISAPSITNTVLKWDGSNIVWDTVSGVGTVTSVNLTAGTGISVSGGPITSSGSITVVNTAPDQIVSLTGAGTTTVTGTYPNFTITSSDQYNGTVTSVAASGGTTGLTFSGGPITTSGTLTLSGTLAVANGGTGATTQGAARTNLGAAASGANTDITSVALTSGTITTSPVNATDIANKSYVDSISAGINFHQAVRLASTTALPAYTYNNGSSGVGATITANANGALTLDGVAVASGNRVLIKNEAGAAQAYNGVYTVTQTGNGSTPFILTRATDYNTAGTGVNQIDAGDFFLVTAGSTQANTSWVQQTPLPITVGTTALVFTQFAAPITYSAGTGLTLAGTVFSITNTGVTATTYGSASSVPVIAVNAQGQITSASNSSIAIAASQVTSGTLATSVGGTGLSSFTSGGAVYATSTSALTTGTLPVTAGGSGATTLTGYVKGNGTSAFTASATIPGSDVAGAALTRTNDTNVTLTLGGSPTTALLAATSLTLGWTGTLAESRGGTGQGSYTIGDILYASGTSTLSRLADVATGNALISGGVNVAPSWGKIDLTTHVSGILPIANGGTGTANGVDGGTF